MKAHVVLRLILWQAINVIPVAISWLQNINTQWQEGKVVEQHWSGWWLFGLQLTLSSAIAWRMYIDGSAEKARQQKERSRNETTS